MGTTQGPCRKATEGEGVRGGEGRLQVFRAPTVQRGFWEICASALAQGGDITFLGRSYKLGTQRPVLPSSDQHEESIRDTGGWRQRGGQMQSQCQPWSASRAGVTPRLCRANFLSQHGLAPEGQRAISRARGSATACSQVRGLAPELYQMLLQGSSKDKKEKEPPKSSRATQKSSVIRGFGEPLQAKGGGEGGGQGAHGADRASSLRLGLQE